MADSMIERVARAIASVNGDENWEDIPANKVDWVARGGMFKGRFRDVNEPKQVDYLDMAQAAIEAMREPTGAMVYPLGPLGLRSRRHAGFVWRKMIDAALKTETE